MAVRRLVAALTLCAVGATDSCGTAAGWELLDANRTALVVIDAQQNFLDKLPLAQRASLVERIAFVMKVAKAMELPILATAEDYAEGGSNPPMHPSLSALLPAGTRVWNKLVWNLYGQPDIRAAVDAVAEGARRRRRSSWSGGDGRPRRRAVGPGPASCWLSRRRRRGRRRHAAAPPRRRHPENARRGRDRLRQGRTTSSCATSRPSRARGPRDRRARRSWARRGADRGCASDRAGAPHTTHTPPTLVVFLLLRGNRTGPARDDGPALAPRAAARARQPWLIPERAPRHNALEVAATRLSRATFCFHCLRAFSGPSSRTNLLPSRVAELVELGREVLVPGVRVLVFRIFRRVVVA